MTTTAARQESSPTGHRRAALLVLALITVVGAVVRATGLGSAGLFYDDAWFALPSRVGIGTAMKMVVTTPGYTLLQDAWISAGPSGNAWPKVLPFLLGVLAAPAGYWLSRRYEMPRWVALCVAGLLAAAPAAIEYSVRVKEYEADLLLGVAVLGVAELVRRRRSGTSLASLAVVSLLAVLMSSSLLVVVGGSWAALIAIAFGDRRWLRSVLAFGVATAAACGLETMWISSHIPSSLTEFWITTHRLVGAPFSSSSLAHTIALTFAGLLHGLVGTPLPTGPFPMTLVISDTAETLWIASGALALVLFVVLVWPVVRSIGRRRDGDPALALLAPSLTMILALVAWVGGAVPLGTGRSDLALYPAIAVLLGAGLLRLSGRLAKIGIAPATRRSATVALTCAAGLATTGLAWHQRSWYPAQDLAVLHRAMVARGVLHPGDVSVVEGRNTYGWAFEGLSPFVVHIDRNDPRGRTVGFWVTFPSDRVLAVESSTPTGAIKGQRAIPGLDQLPPSAHRLWVFGTTNSTYSPSAYRIRGPRGRLMMPMGIDPLLSKHGWTAQHGWTPRSGRVHAPGVVAVLYTR